MVEVTVTVETEINPTEDEEKVRAAVNNVLGNATITVKPDARGSTLFAEAKGQNSLFNLRSIMANDRVRDASRRLLLKSIRGDSIKFFLNKQVAFAGHVSFCEETAESPLGPLRFTIETDNAQALIEWLAERTERR
ncbi:MAG TPA: RNA-binding domain-containing protein [Candidatus Acidoferrales bacterium]|nr:RNA-binding domain-containing protein [Candidatus Acidoferrales bacterium]